MKTDRELLEAAAKAAGVEGKWHEQARAYAAPTGWLMPNGRTWNPLTDDGDALRLAVKIGIRDYFGIEVQKTCAQATCFEPWEHCGFEYHGDNQDPYAATRRAIVRTAAMIE